MAENIYVQISKKVGKDVRLVRKVAHHPFDFFSRSMANVVDQRPVRLRYLGIFAPKDYWRKGMTKSIEGGFPPENVQIFARVPELKFNKVYINLKEGMVNNNIFKSVDGNVSCDISLVEWWCPKDRTKET
jgi:hypothetical protein